MDNKKLKEVKSPRGSFKEINFKELDALLQFKVTKEYVADYLGVSEDTVERRIKEKTGKTYQQYKNLKSANTSLKLQQVAIEMALAKDRTMLKFALKNMSGWKEEADAIDANEEIGISITEDDSKL